MKVFGVFVFILLLSVLLISLMDILLGFKLSHALLHLINPFWVIEPGEYVMIAFLLFITIGQQIMIIIKNYKQKGSN
ncbi:hypothetical protein [Neobacillus cucumis]|uniref:hypothetical protein n=1 Tax=Neobacillus cucumis TaxID=1740721 RepID=UPI002E1E3255|nr:hypothetical protein [Neobacillus cucumis]